jgi:hypothetical protein
LGQRGGEHVALEFELLIQTAILSSSGIFRIYSGQEITNKRILLPSKRFENSHFNSHGY